MICVLLNKRASVRLENDSLAIVTLKTDSNKSILYIAYWMRSIISVYVNLHGDLISF